MKKKIVLFDMDGTLTPAREKIQSDVIDALKSLQEKFEIGIVTGSDILYIEQQVEDLLLNKELDNSQLHLFPCNGTKHYTWNKDQYEKVFDADMIKELGADVYRHVLQNVLSYQLLITIKYDLPYTGTFFDYRGSMLNWCPIGRTASKDQRSEWVEADLKFDIRNTYMQFLKSEFSKKMFNLDVALGGATSFDIYPKGWDKTYVINHLSDYEDILFIGDKCNPGGNDHAIYTLLKDGKGTQSYSVESPEDTIKVIRQNILGVSK